MTRIGVGGIFIECNYFADHLSDLTAFERSELLYGKELLAKNTGVIGGMFSVLEIQWNDWSVASEFCPHS